MSNVPVPKRPLAENLGQGWHAFGASESRRFLGSLLPS